jgi:hypothetical protein
MVFGFGGRPAAVVPVGAVGAPVAGAPALPIGGGCAGGQCQQGIPAAFMQPAVIAAGDCSTPAQRCGGHAWVKVCDPDGRVYREKINFRRLAPVSFVSGPLVPSLQGVMAAPACGPWGPLPQNIATGFGPNAMMQPPVGRAGVQGLAVIPMTGNSVGPGCGGVGAWNAPLVTGQYAPTAAAQRFPMTAGVLPNNNFAGTPTAANPFVPRQPF